MKLTPYISIFEDTKKYVIRQGKKVRIHTKKKPGYKWRNGRVVKMSSTELMKRKKSAKKSAVKRKSKSSAISRKRAKSLKKHVW